MTQDSESCSPVSITGRTTTCFNDLLESLKMLVRLNGIIKIYGNIVDRKNPQVIVL